jgi:hypothetical protein
MLMPPRSNLSCIQADDPENMFGSMFGSMIEKSMIESMII